MKAREVKLLSSAFVSNESTSVLATMKTYIGINWNDVAGIDACESNHE